MSGYVWCDGKRKRLDKAWFDYVAAAATLPELTILFPGDLWRRTTDAEAAAIDAAMSAQSIRLARLFMTAQTYRSDDPLWPLLVQVATSLFGAQRAAELLAPSI